MVATAARSNQEVQDGEAFEQLASQRRRRPGWILAGVGMIVVSMLLGVFLFIATATTEQRLALNGDIVAGEVLTEADLRVVDVNPDSSFASISPELQGQIVGLAANGNMPDGTLLSLELFTEPALALTEGKVNIPYATDVSQLPNSLAGGSPVRMYSVVGDSDGGEQAAAASIGTARVASIGEATNGGPDRRVSLIVDAEVEGQVLQAISDNNLRLVLIGN